MNSEGVAEDSSQTQLPTEKSDLNDAEAEGSLSSSQASHDIAAASANVSRDVKELSSNLASPPIPEKKNTRVASPAQPTEAPLYAPLRSAMETDFNSKYLTSLAQKNVEVEAAVTLNDVKVGEKDNTQSEEESSSAPALNSTGEKILSDEPQSEWQKRRRTKDNSLQNSSAQATSKSKDLPQIRVTLPPDAGPASEIAQLDPENPLMRRIQDALFKQLSDANEKLTIELREKEEELKRNIAAREDAGVELYNMQQRLRNLQERNDEAQNSLQAISKSRGKAETNVRAARRHYEHQNATFQEQLSALEARKTELMNLSRTLAQVQHYFEETKAKLAITRRVALKSDVDLLQQEAEKRSQDFQVNSLVARSERLEEESASLMAQIDIQKRDIQALKQSLQEANTEIEAIVFEKRQLYQEWKNTVSGLLRRQELLSNFEERNATETERRRAMENEISGFRRSLAAITAELESLSAMESKLKLEGEFIESKIQECMDKKQRMSDEYTLLQKSLENHEEQLKLQDREAAKVRNESNSILKQIRAATQKVSKLEKSLAEQLQQQHSVEKGIAGTTKDSRKLLQEIHDKEDILAAEENQVAVTRTQMSAVQGNCDRFKAELVELDRIINEKSEIIDQYELEIRRGNDELARKQTEIDITNKKLAVILAGSSVDALGPLEATIYNLSRAVSAKEKETVETQQFWLRNQNELVASTKKAGELADAIAAQRMRQSVLLRKKELLNEDFEREARETKYHSRNIKALQNEMARTNSLLSKQTIAQSNLEESTLGLEREFRHRLRQAELESLELERLVEVTKGEKLRIIESLLDAERKIMQWEKKIQLAKETREALDPNIGAQELREMAAEIHRMELKLAELEKEQELLVREMEKSIARRETIASQSRVRGKSYPSAVVNKEISDITKKLRNLINELKVADQEERAVVMSRDRVRQQMFELVESKKAATNRQSDLQNDVMRLLEEKILIAGEVNLLQQRKKRLDAQKAGKYVLLRMAGTSSGESSAEDARSKELTQLQSGFSKMEKLFEEFMAQAGDELSLRGDSMRLHIAHARDLVF